jgi:hypothetical protein
MGLLVSKLADWVKPLCCAAALLVEVFRFTSRVAQF